MDKSTLNNHICQNTIRNTEREFQSRIDKETVERVLSTKCNAISRENTDHDICDKCDNKCKNEHGGEVYIVNVGKIASRNHNFRESIWTGKYLQTTIMSIPKGKDIGVELHEDTDQYITVEHGFAIALTGEKENCLDKKDYLGQGDSIFIPAGVWHNIVNMGRCALKLSSVYAPPHHPKCTVEEDK